jgi:transposase InsO family protein
MNEDRRHEIALWRFGVLGPLVSAELSHGDLRSLCKEAAQRCYRRPDGRTVRLSWRTIEDWHYCYQKGGFEALKPAPRADTGSSRAIPEELAELILALKQEKPRRSVRRIVKMLQRDGKVARGRLSKSSVHRLLKAHGMSTCPSRSEQKERQAFRHAFAGECWMGDVMHAVPALDEQGEPHKTYLHAFIDSATRFVPACAFRFNERAEEFEGVLKDAILKHGLVRMIYVDNGPAQIADSLASTCGELGIEKRHAQPGDAAAKGAIERWFRTVRAEVIDELPDEPLPIAKLNGLLWAWVSREYHRREHGGTKRIPLNHWLEHVDHLRPTPLREKLDRAFMHRETRLVRKDNTVRYAGALLEVRGDRAGTTVELRFDPMYRFDAKDPSTLPQVYVNGVFVCDTVLLDPVANSSSVRRIKPTPQSAPPKQPTGIDPLEQTAAEQAHAGRPPRHDTEEG